MRAECSNAHCAQYDICKTLFTTELRIDLRQQICSLLENTRCDRVKKDNIQFVDVHSLPGLCHKHLEWRCIVPVYSDILTVSALWATTSCRLVHNQTKMYTLKICQRMSFLIFKLCSSSCYTFSSRRTVRLCTHTVDRTARFGSTRNSAL